MDRGIPPESIDLREPVEQEILTTGAPPAEPHAPWCIQHTRRGCLGEEFTLPDSRITVWLSRPGEAEDHLVVDYPGGSLEFVIPG